MNQHPIATAIRDLIDELDTIGMSKKTTIREVLCAVETTDGWDLDTAVDQLCDAFPRHHADIRCAATELFPHRALRFSNPPPLRETPTQRPDAPRPSDPLSLEIQELGALYRSLSEAARTTLMETARRFSRSER